MSPCVWDFSLQYQCRENLDFLISLLSCEAEGKSRWVELKSARSPTSKMKPDSLLYNRWVDFTKCKIYIKVILFDDKKEWHTDICYSMNELWDNYIMSKNSVTKKTHTLSDSIYNEMFRTGKSIPIHTTESTLVTA